MKLVVNLRKPSLDCYQNALGYELGFLMDLIFTENVDQKKKNNVVGKHESRRTKFKTEEFLLLFYNIIVSEL